MRLLSIAALCVAGLSFATSVRGEYVLWIATPENIGEIEGLSVEGTRETNGLVRFVVARKTPKSKVFTQGLLRLNLEPNVWTEASVVADKRDDRIEYRVTVAPAHLGIAEFNLVESDGLGGEWHRIPLKAFAPKEAAPAPTEK